jgi:membrane associated rhomboid family serine protease
VGDNDNIIFKYSMNYNFTQGYYFQSISNVFLHGSIEHLAMNMIALFQCAYLLEHRIIWWKFIIIYLLASVLVSVLSLYFVIYILDDIYRNMIGASGVISFLFAYVGYMQRQYLKGIFISILLMSFVPLLLGINIAWYAHIIGFLLGLFSVIIFKKVIFRF